MNIEKTLLIEDLLGRVNASPFLFVVDYTGLTVPRWEELRKRLRTAGAEIHNCIQFAATCWHALRRPARPAVPPRVKRSFHTLRAATSDGSAPPTRGRCATDKIKFAMHTSTRRQRRRQAAASLYLAVASLR